MGQNKSTPDRGQWIAVTESTHASSVPSGLLVAPRVFTQYYCERTQKYFAGTKYLFRGNEIKAYCEGTQYYCEGTKYFCEGTQYLFQRNEINDYLIRTL